MEEVLKLKNNYFFIVVDEQQNIKESLINIKKLNNKIKESSIVLEINFNTIEFFEYKKILKNFFHIKNKYRIGIKKGDKILLGYIKNYNSNNDKHTEFINGINAIFHNSKYEMYEYIYDTTCDYLDKKFISENLCDFKDDKCIANRNATSTTGCCHHYKNKLLGPVTIRNNFVVCEYLQDKNCTAKCLGCKLYTCECIEQNGIKFRIRDMLLIDTFFNLYRKYIIKTSLFMKKEEILKRLLIGSKKHE